MFIVHRFPFRSLIIIFGLLTLILTSSLVGCGSGGGDQPASPDTGDEGGGDDGDRGPTGTVIISLEGAALLPSSTFVPAAYTDDDVLDLSFEHDPGLDSWMTLEIVKYVHDRTKAHRVSLRSADAYFSVYGSGSLDGVSVDGSGVSFHELRLTGTVGAEVLELEIDGWVRGN